MGYWVSEVYGLSHRPRPRSQAILWGLRVYGLPEVWVKRVSTVVCTASQIRSDTVYVRAGEHLVTKKGYFVAEEELTQPSPFHERNP